MTPSTIGPWILAMYLHLAACAGVANPGTPPRVIIGPKEYVPCPTALVGTCYDASCKVRYDGECAGLHRGHRVYLGTKTTGALPHELLHEILHGDVKHANAAWTRCLDADGRPR